MKKAIAMLLISLLVLSLLTACGSAAGSASAPEAEKTESASAASAAETAEEAPAAEDAEFKTMGDVFGFESSCYGGGDDYYVYVFEKDGIIYRATAELPQEVSETVAAIDLFDEQYDTKVREAVSPVEITKLENLTEMIPTQEELDKLIGKTGQELLDDGWIIWSWQDDGTDYDMYHGPFTFTVSFDGTTDTMNEIGEPDISGLTVKSVTYDGIGDATNIEIALP